MIQHSRKNVIEQKQMGYVKSSFTQSREENKQSKLVYGTLKFNLEDFILYLIYGLLKIPMEHN